MKKILLIEPPGNFIRLDRCMQNINSWGGVYRFPLNLSRIGAYLLELGFNVRFIDLQADKNENIESAVIEYEPDLCILSSGYPSMRIDSETAKRIKEILPSTHISTFGVAATSLKDMFFEKETWGFEIFFDSIVIGGEPSIGYEYLLKDGLRNSSRVISSPLLKDKIINTRISRKLFNNSLYKSPFTGENATYVEGTYGCPYECSFCVVPIYYEKQFSKRTAKEIVDEFEFVIDNHDVKQITLWDEGTTFQRSFIRELCDGLCELRKSNIPKFKNFIWTTRSTTALLNEEIVEKLALSGLSGITLGIESFDDEILSTVEKDISLNTNYTAIELLSKYKIISIGHIILGHLHDTKESVERTISRAINSNLCFAQFYCAIPYPQTNLHFQAKAFDLIRVNDLTKYELSNPIMDTLGGLTLEEISIYRTLATQAFWSKERWANLNILIKSNKGITGEKKNNFLNWNKKHFSENGLKQKAWSKFCVNADCV